jgi:hypothetical protein
MGTPLLPSDSLRLRYDRTLESARRALGPDAFGTAWQAGRHLSLEQMVAAGRAHDPAGT